ncbi:uncharacterized protein J3D65DRAFT_688533, partial [Phyllosticta citribraziliensis]
PIKAAQEQRAPLVTWPAFHELGLRPPRSYVPAAPPPPPPPPPHPPQNFLTRQPSGSRSGSGGSGGSGLSGGGESGERGSGGRVLPPRRAYALRRPCRTPDSGSACACDCGCGSAAATPPALSPPHFSLPSSTLLVFSLYSSLYTERQGGGCGDVLVNNSNSSCEEVVDAIDAEEVGETRRLRMPPRCSAPLGSLGGSMWSCSSDGVDGAVGRSVDVFGDGSVDDAGNGDAEAEALPLLFLLVRGDWSWSWSWLSSSSSSLPAAAATAAAAAVATAGVRGRQRDGRGGRVAECCVGFGDGAAVPSLASDMAFDLAVDLG